MTPLWLACDAPAAMLASPTDAAPTLPGGGRPWPDIASGEVHTMTTSLPPSTLATSAFPAAESPLERVQVAGTTLAYQDVGHGTPVILLHSAGASHRQWRALVSQLAPRYRLLVPDLPGHGETRGLPDAARRSREDVAGVVAALAGQAGQPFHLVGHSYGAAVALKLALGWQDRLFSLTLAEPSTFELLREAGEETAWREIESIARRHVALANLGDLDGAADVFMGYWIGTEAWRAMPPQRRAAVRATMPAIADGWPDVYRPQAPLADYGNLTVPTLLLRAQYTTHAAARVVELLHGTLPNHRLVEIAGAGHMAPLTHPEQVNAAVAAHLNRETARARGTGRAVA